MFLFCHYYRLGGLPTEVVLCDMTAAEPCFSGSSFVVPMQPPTRQDPVFIYEARRRIQHTSFSTKNTSGYAKLPGRQFNTSLFKTLKDKALP